jgi:lipoprotein-releasing system permease protein
VGFVRFVAFRYLFAKKRTNFINWITAISFLGVWVGAAALVIVLSVYNGLESLTREMYSKFNPDIRIRPASGKFMDIAEIQPILNGFPGLNVVSYSLQENALIRYGDREVVGVIKGVDTAFAAVSDLPGSMIRGEYVLQDGFGLPYAMLGSGLAYQLQISLNDYRKAIEIYMPRPGTRLDMMQPERAFVQRSVQPAGYFDVQPEINQQYLVISLAFVQDLMGLTATQVGEVAVGLKSDQIPEKVMRQLQQLLGDNFEVKDRYRQEEAIFKIFKTEKWWTYFFLMLIVLIAALNLIGSLSMLVIEKQRDLAILSSLGAGSSQLFSIFLMLGMLITLIGTLLGVGSGALLCWLQQTYEFIEFAGEGSFVVSAYPVELRWLDLLAVCGGVSVIGLLCAFYPASRAARSLAVQKLRA